MTKTVEKVREEIIAILRDDATIGADQILDIEIGGEVAIEYCGNCEFLNPKESEQGEDKKPHYCNHLGRRVYHGNAHPNIYAVCELTRPRTIRDAIQEG